MKKLLPLTLLTFLLLTTAHALFFAGRSVSNYRSIGGIKIDKMGGKTTGIKKINGINFRKKVFDPTEGLVGWWKFDGDATDSSGNGNDGTVYGATLTTDREGNSEGAYSFDGVDDVINCGVDSKFAFGSNNHTFSVWIKTPSIFTRTQYSYIVSVGNDSTGNQSGVGFNNSGNLFWSSYSNPLLNFSNNTSLDPDTWYFFTYVYLNGSANIYIDGSFIETRMISLNVLAGKCHIGTHAGGTSFGSGIYDDVRIYNRALTAEEVQLLYEKY